MDNTLSELEQNQRNFNNQENQYYKQYQENDSSESFYDKVRNFPYQLYDEGTDTLGIRVPRTVKNEFLLLCKENRITSKNVIIYVLENFFKK